MLTKTSLFSFISFLGSDSDTMIVFKVAFFLLSTVIFMFAKDVGMFSKIKCEQKIRDRKVKKANCIELAYE